MKQFLIYGLSLFISSIALAHSNEFNSHEESQFEEPTYMYQNTMHSGHARSGGSTASPLMSFHGGKVLRANATAAIFWGSSWNNTSFASDKISGLDSFFLGFGNSRYAFTSSEYYDSTGLISPASTYQGHLIDSSVVPNRALSTSQAISEVCKVTQNHPDPSTVYFIYTATGAGKVNYCAWHSWGSCSSGAQVQVAYMPNIDGIAGCDPQDSSSGHSQGLAAVANVTAHELLESITDPRGSSWFDSSGQENGDKCAWSFPPGNGLSTFSNSTVWKLQMEWSNSAYLANTGLANLSAQHGCIY